MITMIGFDGDDTLWHNESLFAIAQDTFRKLLLGYHGAEWIDQKLLETEQRNLKHFGYGAKGFGLSMIETAIELTEGRISGLELKQILDAVRDLVSHPATLLPQVSEVLAALSSSHRLILITKGDLFEQENKIARSGLADSFHLIEILSEKSVDSYGKLLEKHAVAPDEFLMVGNSIRSDILPVLKLGARAAYIPYHLTWQHELSAEPVDDQRFVKLKSIGELPAHLDRIGQGHR